MYDQACMEMIGPNEMDWPANTHASRDKEWEISLASVREALPPSPSRAYSKRSTHMAELRTSAEWATRNADEFILAPSSNALSSAKNFINNLPDACLEFRLAISQCGEINFFFGSAQELFQILIDESGMLSYYAKLGDEELRASDVASENFQYMRLFQFVERNK
ncbi:MAG: hypothetical protein V4673_15380 [Pseudomonadota bacterium]